MKASTLSLDEVRRHEVPEILRRRQAVGELPQSVELAALVHEQWRRGAIPAPAAATALCSLAQRADQDEAAAIYALFNPGSPVTAECDDPEAALIEMVGCLVTEDLTPNGFRTIVERWKPGGVLGQLDPNGGLADKSHALLSCFTGCVENERLNRARLATVIRSHFDSVKLDTESVEAELASFLADASDSAKQQETPGGGVSAGEAPRREPLNECQAVATVLLVEAAVRQAVSRELTGLALSGGGIRSASFNLGLCQALIDRKVYPGLDYLSTVSGGGYIGSHLSSLFLERKIDHGNLPIATRPDGSQSRHIRRMLQGGEYLSSPLGFLDRYCVGLLANHLVIASGLLATCALIALAWRALDMEGVHRILTWISNAWLLDWNRPFVYLFMAAFVWIGLWLVSEFSPGSHRRAAKLGCLRQAALAGVIVCFLIGWAVWLGNPHINTIPGGGGPQRASEAPAISAHRYLVIALLTALGLVILPILNPRKLLASGQVNQGYWHQLLFKTVSTGLLCGVPLSLVFLLAQHNLSGEASRPGRTFVSTDIDSWDDFWRMAGQVSSSEPAGLIVQRYPGSGRDPSAEEDLAAVRRLADAGAFRAIEKSPIRLSPLKFWQHGNLRDRVARRIDQLLSRQEMLNRVIRENRDELEKRIESFTEEGRRHLAEDKFLRRGEMSTEEEARRLAFLVAAAREDAANLPEDSLREANHLLLRIFYPEHIRKPTLVRRKVIVAADQWYRLVIFGVSSCVFLLACLVINLNMSSPQPFYQERLVSAYIRRTPGGRIPALSRLREAIAKGAPVHLLGATLSGFAQLKRCGDATFIFSPLYCGSKPTGFADTQRYEERCGKEIHLGSAMAISGAAVNPLQMRSLFGAVLMSVLNLRLGRWIPNPAKEVPHHRCRPTAWNLLRDLWQAARRRRRAICLLTDGGHYENLGLEQLLHRRCAVMIASDAGQDGEREFQDLARLYRRARLNGIRIVGLDGSGTFSLRPMHLLKRRRQVAERQFLVGAVVYPDGRQALLIYIKPALSECEEVDIERHSKGYEKFPHDPTSDVAFDEDRVESYRQLGYSIGSRVVDELERLRRTSDLHERSELQDLQGANLLRLLARRQIFAATEKSTTADDGQPNVTVALPPACPLPDANGEELSPDAEEADTSPDQGLQPQSPKTPG